LLALYGRHRRPPPPPRLLLLLLIRLRHHHPHLYLHPSRETPRSGRSGLLSAARGGVRRRVMIVRHDGGLARPGRRCLRPSPEDDDGPEY